LSLQGTPCSDGALLLAFHVISRKPYLPYPGAFSHICRWSAGIVVNPPGKLCSLSIRALLPAQLQEHHAGCKGSETAHLTAHAWSGR
jgi:hypothetical protein